VIYLVMLLNFFFIIFCLILGGLLRISGKLPKNAAHVLNVFVIWISLPSLILIQIPALLNQTKFGFDLLIPMSMAWIQFIAAFLLIVVIGKRLKWARAEMGALILTAGLGNTSFLGYPILEALYGQEGLRIGVLVDQLGTFLVFGTLGVIAASFFSPASGREIKLGEVLKRILTFPPLVALILATCWHFTGTYGYNDSIIVLDKLSATVVPLALIAVGFQLKLSTGALKRQWMPLLWGLSFKLFLAPIIFIILYVFLLSTRTFPVKITILQSAMAPMILGAVLAEEFGLNAEIANLMVGVGIPISIITVFCWDQLISKIFF